MGASDIQSCEQIHPRGFGDGFGHVNLIKVECMMLPQGSILDKIMGSIEGRRVY